MPTKTGIEKAIETIGKEPVYPIGKCFDNIIPALRDLKESKEFFNIKICHGIGIANMPGQEGKSMAHAWLECQNEQGCIFALDVSWMVIQPAVFYKKELSVKYEVKYSIDEFLDMFFENNYPGPWDKKIQEVIDHPPPML